MSENKSYVYLLTDTLNNDIYKIGVTRDSIEKRIKKLQTGNPGEIYICQYFETKYPFFVEKHLHFRFGNNKVLNEWFYLPDGEAMKFKEYCEFAEELIKNMGNNPFFPKNIK